MNRPHLGAETVADIRRRAEAGYSVTELARAFGRSRQAISRIVRGESYKKVDADAVAAFTPLPTKRGGAARLMEQLRQRDEPRVRHAPTPAPTTIYHLGSATDGPRCQVQTLGGSNEYAATLKDLRELVGMGVGVCKRCFSIGQKAHRDMFPPGPMGVF